MAKFFETIAIVVIFCCLKITWCYQGKNTVTHRLQPDETYVFKSPGFPEKYPPGSIFKWFLSAPIGYELKMSCPTVDIPIIEDKCMDFLNVTHYGKYVGVPPILTCEPIFDVISNTIIVFFRSSGWSDGGVFECRITTRQVAEIPNVETSIVDYQYEAINKTCQCGYTFQGQSRIVGGRDAEIHEFPSLASIVYLPYGGHICGATIIGPRVALTAAHCFEATTKPKLYKLMVGEHDKNRRNESDAEKPMAIKEIIVHQLYEMQPLYPYRNDIALIITEEEIQFTNKVGPVCLPFNIDKESIMGKYVAAAGWGNMQHNEVAVSLFEGTKPSPILQTTRLQLVDDSTCSNIYKGNYFTSGNICASSPGANSCHGDSGGPLYYFDPMTKRHTQVGIVSMGSICPMPTVYTDVHFYLDWIKQNIPAVINRAIRVLCHIGKTLQCYRTLFAGSSLTVLGLFILQSLVHVYLNRNKLVLSGDSHNYNTRHGSKFLILFYKTKKLVNSCNYIGIQLFNKMPGSFSGLLSVKAFKAKIKEL